MLLITFFLFSLSHSARERSRSPRRLLPRLNGLIADVQARILDLGDDAMRRNHQFTCEEYFNEGEDACQGCRAVSDSLQQKIKDCGIAKTVGGGASILAGCSIIGGVIAAPFSGGASLGLTIAGITGGLASGATTITAEIIKSDGIKGTCQEVDQKLEAIQKKREIVHNRIQAVADAQETLRQELESYGSLEAGINEFQRLGLSVSGTGGSILYNTYLLIDAVRTTREIYAVANFIGADAAAISGCAEGFTASGFRILRAGSGAAKCLSCLGGAVSIGFGIWDMVDGIDDATGGHDVVKQIRENADVISDALKNERTEIENLRSQIIQDN